MRLRLSSYLASAVAVAFLVGCNTDAANAPTGPDAGKVQATLGNGYPQGGHDYQLTLIGVPKDKTADLEDNNGRRIFVQLESDNTVCNPGGKNNCNGLPKGGGDDQNHIYLCNSTANENDVTGDLGVQCDAWRADGHQDDFGVIDANATDGDGALFGLPDPCAGVSSLDGCTPIYRIWARAITPQGNATLTLCADETGAGFDGADDVWCGSNGISFSKQSHFKAGEVTSALLSMVITVPGTDDQLQNCINGTTGVDFGTTTYTIWLFDRCFENYFWNYDNNGLKHLQLRFFSAASLS